MTQKYYSIGNAFDSLGFHLFGKLWDGYEIWGRKAFDCKPTVEARKPFEQRLEETFSTILEKKSELRDVLSREDIQRINNDISNLHEEQNQIYYDLRKIGEVEKFNIVDRGRWERFEITESYLLKAFRNSELTVECFLGMIVSHALWAELPKGFGFDWELSLIFMPQRESSKRVFAGKVRTEEFETWLYSITPEHIDDARAVPIEQQAQLWLREQVKAWDRREKRDSFKERARFVFPDLGERAFKRIWDKEATSEMSAPGPRKPR